MCSSIFNLKVGASLTSNQKGNRSQEKRMTEGSWEMDAIKTLLACVEP